MKKIYSSVNWDALKHLETDVELWKKYGSGPTDKTTEKMRSDVGEVRFGKFIQDNYEKLQSLATRMKRESFSYEELKNMKDKGIDNYGK